MSINCKDLFEIFMKIGGKLTCRNDTNECKFEPQNIICKDLNKNQYRLKNLVESLDESLVKYINEDIISGIKLRFFQNYRLSSCVGFEMNFRVDDNGNKISVAREFWDKITKGI